MTEVAAYHIPDKKTVIYVSGKDVFKSASAFQKHLCEQWGFSNSVAAQHIETVAANRSVSEQKMITLLEARGMTPAAIKRLLGITTTKPRKKKIK